jgi:hypothetical protein
VKTITISQHPTHITLAGNHHPVLEQQKQGSPKYTAQKTARKTCGFSISINLSGQSHLIW